MPTVSLLVAGFSLPVDALLEQDLLTKRALGGRGDRFFLQAACRMVCEYVALKHACLSPSVAGCQPTVGKLSNGSTVLLRYTIDDTDTPVRTKLICRYRFDESSRQHDFAIGFAHSATDLLAATRMTTELMELALVLEHIGIPPRVGNPISFNVHAKHPRHCMHFRDEARLCQRVVTHEPSGVRVPVRDDDDFFVE